MKMKFLRLCLTAIFLLAVSSAALSDIWIDDNVKSEGYVGRYYEADIYVLATIFLRIIAMVFREIFR